jgi:hypothetical protein
MSESNGQSSRPGIGTDIESVSPSPVVRERGPGGEGSPGSGEHLLAVRKVRQGALAEVA